MKMKKLHVIVVMILVFVGLSSCYYDNKAEMYGNTVCDTANPTYANTIQPLINQNCIGCHGATGGSGGISLASYTQVKAEATRGSLEGTMNQSAGFGLMPPGGKLSSCKLNQVAKWIRNGAPQ